MPSKALRIFAIVNGILSSIVTLIILVNSFDGSGEKYVPAMMLANKFAFPLIVSALALVFLVFFEPEALRKMNVILSFRVIFLFTLTSFSYYCIFHRSFEMYSPTFFTMCFEEIFLVFITFQLFKIHHS
jgi:hypothetical protein